MKPELNIGLIGAGYMGKAYAIALKAVGTVYDLPLTPVCHTLAVSNPKQAEDKARALGFQRVTTDWQSLIDNPEIDVIAVCTPTYLHKEMVQAALRAGKHVICEKPLALNAAEARLMAQAAAQADVKTQVGYCYAKNPAAKLAKKLIEEGRIGEITHFRGTHNEDYLLDPSSEINWRLQKDTASEAGALLDLASHIINMGHYLCGPIESVVGRSQIVIPKRPDRHGNLHPVENDDQANLLAQFANGALASFECSRVAAGRKMGLTYEITGTKGSLYFDQERMAELQLYEACGDAQTQGFKTILIGPEHPEYVNFCLGAGHGFGYNGMIVVQMKDFIESVATGVDNWATFKDALHTAEVVESVITSTQTQAWVKVPNPQEAL
jgi:predicted dehydrogenase